MEREQMDEIFKLQKEYEDVRGYFPKIIITMLENRNDPLWETYSVHCWKRNRDGDTMYISLIESENNFQIHGESFDAENESHLIERLKEIYFSNHAHEITDEVYANILKYSELKNKIKELDDELRAIGLPQEHRRLINDNFDYLKRSLERDINYHKQRKDEALGLDVQSDDEDNDDDEL